MPSHATCRRLLLAVGLIAASVAVAASRGQAGSAVLSGVVVDGAGGAPLEDALVSLSLSGPTGRSVPGTERQQLTDERGRFVFTTLPPSTTYRLTVTKFGYFEGAFARTGVPTGQPGMLVIGDGAWVSNVTVTLWRPGAISGAVFDERGEPVVGIYVRVLARLRIQGRDELAAGAYATTDDRGMYRIAGLGPGRYLVHVPSPQATVPMVPPATASPAAAHAMDGVPSLVVDATTRLALGHFPLPPPPQNGRALAYPMAFHPGGRSVASAEEIDLHFGEERSGVNVVIEPVAASRVSGRVEAPPEGFANLTVRLLAPGLENLANSTEIATARVAPDGSFTFVNVPAGTYTLDAPFAATEFVTAPGTSNPNLVATPGSSASTMLAAVDAAPPGTWIATRGFSTASANHVGRTTVTVDATDTSGVVLTLHPTGTMTGRVMVDTDPSLNTGRLMSPATAMLLEPATGNPSLGILQPDYRPEVPDQFSFRGLGTGEYLVRGGGGPWMIKSVIWNGRDYTTAPFDAATTQDFTNVVVTFTNRVPAIAGTVTSAKGEPSAGAAVIAFRLDPSRWTNFGFRPADMKSTLSGNAGVYQLDGLPAGDYYVIAVDGERRMDWLDAQFLAAAAPRATRVTIGWGEKKTVALVLREVK